MATEARLSNFGIRMPGDHRKARYRQLGPTAVVRLRRRCPATPDVTVLAAELCCYRSLRAVLFSLFGDAGFVVSQRREFRPNRLIERVILPCGRGVFRGVIAIFVVFRLRTGPARGDGVASRSDPRDPQRSSFAKTGGVFVDPF